MDICGDNRFAIIARAKEHLLDATNIDTAPKEMEVLDEFLFRCWQMGWLDRYDQSEPKTNGYQTYNGTSVYISRLEDEPKAEVCYTDSTDYQGANDYVTQTERIETYSCQEHCRHWSDKANKCLLAKCDYQPKQTDLFDLMDRFEALCNDIKLQLRKSSAEIASAIRETKQ